MGDTVLCILGVNNFADQLSLTKIIPPQKLLFIVAYSNIIDIINCYFKNACKFLLLPYSRIFSLGKIFHH